MLKPQVGVGATARRVGALVRRHAYLMLKSWPRIVSMMYYPTVTMIVWAFVTLYLAPTNNFLRDAPGFFIGAVLLWDVLFRGQLGVSLTFIEEIYSRNLGNLFVSPLTLPEFIARPARDRVLRALIGVGGACLFAWLLFEYSIFSLGLPLIAFFVNLLIAFGWAIGLAMSGLILRFGLGRRGAGVGGDLPDRAGVGRLLPDLRAAGVAAAGCGRDALGVRVRRDAGGAGRARRCAPTCSSARARCSTSPTSRSACCCSPRRCAMRGGTGSCCRWESERADCEGSDVENDGSNDWRCGCAARSSSNTMTKGMQATSWSPTARTQTTGGGARRVPRPGH